MRPGLFFVAFMFLTLLVHAQELPDVTTVIKPPQVDSNYVQLNESRWTIRFFGNFKYLNFGLKNDEAKVDYRPRNSFSTGIGFTYQTLLVDIGLRIVGKDALTTKRFDIQSSLLLGSFFANFILQNYKGFEVKNSGQPENFREDIRTFSTALDVVKVPNHRQLAFRALQSGIDLQRRSSGSILYGAFIGLHRMKSDSSIIPPQQSEYFDEENQIDFFKVRMVGLTFGYAHVHPITERFYIGGSVRPGLGLQWGEYNSESTNERLPGALFTKMDIYMGAGMNWKKFYTALSFSVNTNFVNMPDKYLYNFNTGRLKLILGYKLYKTLL